MTMIYIYTDVLIHDTNALVSPERYKIDGDGRLQTVFKYMNTLFKIYLSINLKKHAFSLHYILEAVKIIIAFLPLQVQAKCT